MTFTAACDGTQQRYIRVLPAGFAAGRAHDVLIALHGHGSDRWQFVKDPRDECRAARDVAAEFGMLFVSPDYRASTSWMGPEAEADMLDIIADLRKAHEVARVFVCGGSMGGAACLTFAALHPDLVDGVASMNGIANFIGYENFQDAIRRSFGGTKAEVPEEYRKRSAEFHAATFTMPVGLTTGGKDASTPPDSVLRLAAALEKTNPHVLLIHRKDEGHRTSYADARRILEFVVEKAGRRGQ
jgi:pimeloyl-ACP methyl ester carboxylesterase